MKNVSSINNLENRVPKLRFPEFEGKWQIISLEDYLIESKELSCRKDNFPLMTSSRKGLFIQQDYFDREQISSDDTLFSIVPKGYVTYRHMSDDDIFHFNINKIVEYGLVSKEYPVFTTNSELNKTFLVEYLNSSDRFLVFCKQQKKGGTRTRLYFNTLCQHKMLAPSISEQEKITSFLILLDQRIAKQRELVENLKLYKRGLVSAIFGRKKRFKDKDGNEFPMWKKSMFSELFKIHPNNTLSRSELTYSNNGVYNVHYGDVLIKFGAYIDFNNDIVPTINASTSLKAFADTAYLQDGDVVFADTAEDYTVGKVSEIYGLNKKLALSGLHTIPCRPNRQFAPKYLGYYFNSYTYREQMLPTIQGSKVSSISRAELQNSYLMIPCIEEQTAISDFLSSIDQKIIHCSYITDTLTEYKKSIMQKIFI